MELHAAGRLAEAIEVCRRAVTIAPNHPDALCNLGYALRTAGRADEAAEWFGRTVAIEPNHLRACRELAHYANTRGRFAEAMQWHQRVLAVAPNDAAAWFGLGTVLVATRQSEQAVEELQKALALKPDWALPYSELAVAQRDLGRLDDALASSRRSVALDPNLFHAQNSLAHILAVMGRVDEAIAAYRQAAELEDQRIGAARSNLLFTLHSQPTVNCDAIFREHLEWSRRVAQPLARLIRPNENDRDLDRRLRIGYMSPDFRQHSVGYFIEPILRHHDRAQFEVICYADVLRPDAATERLQTLADQWIDLLGMPDESAQRRVREDRIDILVDLAGHTSGNRLRVFAAQPAPVQVTYLGYAATTGLTTMQWRLTDERADPVGTSEAYHTERLWRLPQVFLCYAAPADAPPVGTAWRQAGRPVTFGCFNALHKTNRPTMEFWGQILRAVPNSRLMLKAHGLQSAEVRRDIVAAFEQWGVGAHRLELLPLVRGLADHLACYHRIDIALDTFPYNGTTTTCEALWMGAAVVTLRGRAHASRVGGSLLSAIGLTDLIADDEESYVRIAIQLAEDEPRLHALRLEMRQRMMRSPLMDGPGFTRTLEHAYRSMWQQWARPESPSA
jgi:predicted O-linked N-acetylglucosamine transferase (SPINDLY family)